MNINYSVKILAELLVDLDLFINKINKYKYNSVMFNLEMY